MFVHSERPPAPCVRVYSDKLDKLKLVPLVTNLRLPPACLSGFVRTRRAVFVPIPDIWQEAIRAPSTEASTRSAAPGAHIASKSISSVPWS